MGNDGFEQSPELDHQGAFWRSGVFVDHTLAGLSTGQCGLSEFKLLADYLPTLCWLANSDGYIVWYNRRWHDYCGTTPEEMEGWGWRSVHHPAWLPEVEANWQASIERGEPFEMTFPLKAANGDFRPFLTRIVPVRDATGDVARWFGLNIEVSELVAAEEASRAASGRLRRVLDGMGEGFALLDRDFRILDVNAEALRMETRSREALVGKTHWEAYPGTEASELGILYQRAMAERVPVSLQHRYEWEAGHYAWLEMRAYPVEEGLAIFYRDITERYEAEHAFRREAERVQLALDAGAIIGTWDWDLRKDSFSIDERFAESFGIDRKLGREGLSLEQIIATVHPEDRDGLKAAIEEVCARGGKYAHQYRVKRADGEYYWIEANGRVDLDQNGDAYRFPGVLLNLEEQRAIQRERDDALALLKGFTEGIPGVVYAKDRQGRMLVANQGTAELIGKPPQIFLGKTDAEFLDHAEQARDVMANDQRVMSSGRAEQIEEIVSYPDGRQVIWWSTKAPFTDKDGNVIGLIGSSVDITEKKRLEAELRDLNTTLEARVAERTSELLSAEEALRQAQKMEAVGQLTGGIAHDFNNLLTVVTGNIDMANRALAAAGIGDARARRALDNAMKGAERAATLTQRLLAFSRRQPLAPKSLDVDKLVLGMSDMLNRALGEMVKVEIVTSPGLWRVEADPNQLENALLNLAVNARDAMITGGVLTIETANARLDEEYSAAHAEVAPGQYVVIAVTDTGSGMSKDTQARVFEPFFTTKDVGKGTGLGLSQVYGFTKQSGGHVKIYSEEGRGTTVKIYLPRLIGGEAEAESALGLAGLETASRRETILAVEDDDDVRAYTVECLRELGYRVLEAHDGPSALRLIERQQDPIDLLFTDVVMPRMSGRELAEKLRESHPQLKVLYTSGYTRNAIVHGDRLDEGVEMIPKPFTYQALAAKVRDVLEAGRTWRVLIVEAQPTVRAFMAEALGSFGYSIDEAANGAEALMKVRAARGSYDAIVLDADLPDRHGEALANELRLLHADMPLLIASDDSIALSRRFAHDRCTGLLPKPYTGAKLAQALNSLGVRCVQARAERQ